MAKLRVPTIDETRAYVQIFSALSMVVAFLYLVFSGRGSEDLIFRMLIFMTGLTNGINGVALHMRNSSGKRWGDPEGEKQDQLPMQPEQHDDRMRRDGE